MKFHKNQTLWFSSTFMTLGVHENQLKSDDSIFTKNQTLLFYSIFKKIEVYDFCGFSCTPGVMKVDENQSVWFLWIFMYRVMKVKDKLKRLIFVDFHVPSHENWRKLNRLIFVSFHVPVVMKIEENWIVWFLGIFIKIEENWIVWFLRIFMYPGSWKLKKIESSDFWGFSWFMKVEENQSV